MDFDLGYEDALSTLYSWITAGLEETDEVRAILDYIEFELGWDGDEPAETD